MGVSVPRCAAILARGRGERNSAFGVGTGERHYAAAAEAARGGQTRVLATHHAGFSVGSAVRADLSRLGDALKVETVDISRVPGCERVDVLIVIAEHATYSLAGRTEGSLMRAVHSADPMLSDLLVARLSEITGRPFE